MSSLPPITDHAFWRMVRERYDSNPDRSTPEIAAELGCTADELVRWVMAYKSPKKHTSRDTTKYGPAIEAGGFPVRTHAAMARGFEKWRKGQTAEAGK